MAKLTDLAAIATSFVELGGPIFGKRVLNWDLKNRGIQIRTNVTKPQVLTKLSAKGKPIPYRNQDDSANNGVKYTDRTLYVRQSKWDFDFDPKDFHNTYLADESDATFVEAANEQIAKEYLEALLLHVLWNGVYNAAGTDTPDIATGWGTIIAAEIAAGKLTPVVTGAITNANAVAAVEAVAEAVPVQIRTNGFRVLCSYATLDKYKKNYRATYGYSFDADEQGRFKLDNLNAYLEPQDFMGTSQRLVATVDGNLVLGTDIESVDIAASMRRNIIEGRQMMDIGCEIQDLEALVVNDQA